MPNPTILWAQQLTSYNSLSVYCTNTDSLGNVYVGGLASPGANHVINFGSGDIPFSSTALFLVKYTPNGAVIWYKVFRYSITGSIQSITTDSLDNVIIAGYWTGTCDFGGGTRSSVGFSDCFVAKYDPLGVWTWDVSFFSVSNTYGQSLMSIRSDVTNSIYVGVRMQDTTNFGGSFTAIPSGLAVAKLNSGGTVISVFNFTTRGQMFSISPGINGYFIISGYANGPIDFGGGVSAAGGVYVANLRQSDGAYGWSHVFGSTIGYGYSDTDASGGVYLSGTFLNGADFGGGPTSVLFPGPPLNQNGGAFLVGFSSTGTWQWTKVWANDPSNTGCRPNGVQVVGSTVSACIKITGYSDVCGSQGDVPGWNVLFSYSLTGLCQGWLNTGTSNNTGVVKSTSGNLLLIGAFTGAVGLGGITLSTGYYPDSYVAQYFVGSIPAIPATGDFTPVYAPSANTTFQSKFGFIWNGTLPPGATNILIKYSFPAGTITPGPGETTPFLLLNYPEPSGYFGPNAYGFVYKVTGGDGPTWGPGYTTILNWSWAAAFADASGTAIGPYTAWQNVTKSAAVNVTNNGTVASTPYANPKVTTNPTNRGNLQSISLS